VTTGQPGLLSSTLGVNPDDAKRVPPRHYQENGGGPPAVMLSCWDVADLVRSPPVPSHHHSARGLALLSSREVERLLIERGVEVFYETVCRWVLRPQGNAEGKQAAWNDEYMLSLQAG
jgi:hypothetical protein